MTKEELIEKYFPERDGGVCLLRLYVPIVISDTEIATAINLESIVKCRYEDARDSVLEWFDDKLEALG